MKIRDQYAPYNTPNYIFRENSCGIQWVKPKPIVKTEAQLLAEKQAHDEYWANYQKPDAPYDLFTNRFARWGANDND